MSSIQTHLIICNQVISSHPNEPSPCGLPPVPHWEQLLTHFYLTHISHFHCHLSLFPSPLSLLSLSLLSLSLIPSLSISLFISIAPSSAAVTHCVLRSLSLVSPLLFGLQEAQQMMHTLTACGRSTTRFTDSSVEESRDTKKRKQDGVIWRPSSFVMYLQSPTVTLLWDIL